MEYVAEIMAELNGYPSTQKLVVKQGDIGSRYVRVTLMSGGAKFAVDDSITPRVAMRKPDETQILSDDNIEILNDGTLKILLTEQMTAVAGPGQLDIGLYQRAALLSTATICIIIYPSALSMIRVASSDEYQSLIDALAQIAPAIDEEERRKQAERERGANETRRINNEVKRESECGQALEAVNFLVNDVQGKLDRNEFRGDSGVVVPVSGMFTLSGDADGNLWAYYVDGSSPPQFETDEEGNIYFITPNA